MVPVRPAPRGNDGQPRPRTDWLQFEITDTYGHHYTYRLDAVTDALVERQCRLYRRDPAVTYRYYGDDHPILFAIDPTTNLLLWDGKRGLTEKIGHDPTLERELATWYAEHREFVPATKGQGGGGASSYDVYLNNQNLPIVLNIRSGGIHGAVPLRFSRASNLVAYDPDFSSYYPYILIQFICAAETYQGMAEMELNRLNRALKKTNPRKRGGVKIMSNSISGKAGGGDEISNHAESKNTCYTGEIQNAVQLIGSLGFLLNPGLVDGYDAYFATHTHLTSRDLAAQMDRDGHAMMQVINVNTDGNLNLTSWSGFRRAQKIIDDIYGKGFDLEHLPHPLATQVAAVFDLPKYKR